MERFVSIENKFMKHDKIKEIKPSDVEKYVLRYLRTREAMSSALGDALLAKISKNMIEEMEKNREADSTMNTYLTDEGIRKFREIIEEEEKQFRKAGDEILERTSFMESFKLNQGAKIHDVGSSDARFQYQKQCIED